MAAPQGPGVQGASKNLEFPELRTQNVKGLSELAETAEEEQLGTKQRHGREPWATLATRERSDLSTVRGDGVNSVKLNCRKGNKTLKLFRIAQQKSPGLV